MIACFDFSKKHNLGGYAIPKNKNRVYELTIKGHEFFI